MQVLADNGVVGGFDNGSKPRAHFAVSLFLTDTQFLLQDSLSTLNDLPGFEFVGKRGLFAVEQHALALVFPEFLDGLLSSLSDMHA